MVQLISHNFISNHILIHVMPYVMHLIHIIKHIPVLTYISYVYIVSLVMQFPFNSHISQLAYTVLIHVLSILFHQHAYTTHVTMTYYVMYPIYSTYNSHSNPCNHPFPKITINHIQIIYFYGNPFSHSYKTSCVINSDLRKGVITWVM